VSNLVLSSIIIQWFYAINLPLNLDKMNIMKLVTKNSSHLHDVLVLKKSA